MPNFKKTLKTLSFLFIALFVSILISEYNSYTAEAGSGHNVSGYSWSENIGWISFNNLSDGSVFDYGVNVSPSTGYFSGYAWSDNVGWVDFAPTNGFPETPNHGAKLESNNSVTGWAKVLSADGNGWDGWIKMSGSWTNGVSLNPTTGSFQGYAWGSDVLGWVNFKPVYGNVSLSQCGDGVDNNGNGWIDAADPGCALGTLEGNSPTLYQCSDGINNDPTYDSLIDGNDPHCSGPTDNKEAPDFDFNLSSSNQMQIDIIVSSATSSATTINLNSIAGFSSNVSLSASSAIIGAQYIFTSTALSSPYSSGSIFKVIVPGSTSPGSYTITVKGVGGGLERTVQVPLVISVPAPSFEEF